MELNQHYLFEELFALKREIDWEFAMPTDINAWNFDCSDSMTMDELNLSYLLNAQGQYSFPADQFTAAAAAASTGDSMSFEVYNGEYPIMNMEEEELGILEDEIHNLEVQANCKVEAVQSPEEIVPNAGDLGPKIVNSNRKKLQGQPSKNLMAERRRRKRLNDRLSMLRSIVPKISKMDRTAILADAIEYVKELVEKITNLQREIEAGNDPNKLGILRDLKRNEYLVRNSAKFNVERREGQTGIEICCAAKPGLLLSTVQTLEALGLDIQHCVVSCFNDFAMQASCSEGEEQRRRMSTEEVKQALFQNAGYGGRCP
ncbi:transcription factor bHLH93-like [Cucurbita moschata]|uniref:Transcription factor bHLH93-like n=1 Tax=Cucurbita moschata TaxID=3662 RepID=A0A6J1F615_CUCMO|nr:transcription factor bHLH93-like [Cucurbita moschata]